MERDPLAVGILSLHFLRLTIGFYGIVRRRAEPVAHCGRIDDSDDSAKEVPETRAYIFETDRFSLDSDFVDLWVYTD